MRHKTISRTKSFFIHLGMALALLIAGAFLLRHYSADYSTPESIAIILLVLGGIYAGIAIHQSDEAHRENMKRIEEHEAKWKTIEQLYK